MDDLDAIHRILDLELDFTPGDEPPPPLAERRTWLEWSIMNYQQLARLYQFPYGDRAIVLKEGAELVGSCGFVPSLGPFAQLPSYRAGNAPADRRFIPEVGLYYAVAPPHQRKGYAAEASRALIDYGFRDFHLRRIVATTERDNAGSIGVMRRLGMRLDRNPYPDPPWFQVVGILENPDGAESPAGG
jgi:RimJ/RimL family protein N-acetyltransferase